MPPTVRLVRPQSAVVPYRFTDGALEFLLITSMRKKKWIVPKGLVEFGLSAQESAEQEAYEEAGVLGIVEPQMLGVYEYAKWGGFCRVEVYLMKVETVLKDWPEEDERKRRWFPARRAIREIHNDALREILEYGRKVLIKKLHPTRGGTPGAPDDDV